jgi:hypothetical protein
LNVLKLAWDDMAVSSKGDSKAIARLVEWSERVDEMIHVRDQEITEIPERLKRLENGTSS